MNKTITEAFVSGNQKDQNINLADCLNFNEAKIFSRL